MINILGKIKFRLKIKITNNRYGTQMLNTRLIKYFEGKEIL